MSEWMDSSASQSAWTTSKTLPQIFLPMIQDGNQAAINITTAAKAISIPPGALIDRQQFFDNLRRCSDDPRYPAFWKILRSFWDCYRRDSSCGSAVLHSLRICSKEAHRTFCCDAVVVKATLAMERLGNER